MTQPSAAYSKKPALPSDDIWGEEEEEEGSSRAGRAKGSNLSKKERSARGAAANHGGGLDQSALQKKLQAYFGSRAAGMQVVAIADVDDDDDAHDGLLAYGGVAASQRVTRQLLDENTGELQSARQHRPMSGDDDEWEHAKATDWRW